MIELLTINHHQITITKHEHITHLIAANEKIQETILNF